MGEWYKCELHTHTYHSDGQQTISELLEKATDIRQLDAIAITDHNTITAYEDSRRDNYDLLCIPGIEWTTFYGHIVILGLKSFADWREVNPISLDAHIHDIRQQGGVFGIAHPCRLGDPVSTGSDFVFKDYKKNTFDYMEVWTRQRSMEEAENRANMAFWEEHLNKGFRLPGIHATDWHHGCQEKGAYLSTYIYAEKREQEHILRALKQGKVQCGYGACLGMSTFEKKSSIRLFGGESILRAGRKFSLCLREESYDKDCELLWVSNKGIIAQTSLAHQEDLCQVVLEEDYVWMRGQLMGRKHDGSKEILGFTSPLYREDMQ